MSTVEYDRQPAYLDGGADEEPVEPSGWKIAALFVLGCFFLTMAAIWQGQF